MMRRNQIASLVGLPVALFLACGCGTPPGYPKIYKLLETQVDDSPVDRHSKSWKETRSFDDFCWLKEHALKKGVSASEVLRLLGTSLKVDKDESNDVWWYKMIEEEKKEFYACYLGIDKAGKLLWVTAKGAL
jgi:hypothetical protein